MSNNQQIIEYLISRIYQADLIDLQCHVAADFTYSSMLVENLNFREYVNYVESIAPYLQFCFEGVKKINDNEFIVNYELQVTDHDPKNDRPIRANSVFKFKDEKITSIFMNYADLKFAADKLEKLAQHIELGRKFLA